MIEMFKFGKPEEPKGLDLEILQEFGLGGNKINILDPGPENESKEGILIRINNFLKERTGKLSLAAAMVLFTMVARQKEVGAKEVVQDFAHGKVPVTSETKAPQFSREQLKLGASEQAYSLIIGSGYLSHVELSKAQIDIVTGKVEAEGRITKLTDYKQLGEILTFKHDNPLRDEVEAKKKDIQKIYDKKHLDPELKLIVMKDLKLTLEQDFLLTLAVWAEAYFDYLKNPKDENIRKKYEIVEKVVHRDMIGVAAMIELTK